MMKSVEALSVPYHEEKLAHINGITLAYDAFGDPSSRPLLLVAGLGMQLIGWDEEFCRQLAAQDFYVVRYDQRDVGHSTRYDAAEVPNLLSLFQNWQQGTLNDSNLPYSLADLADDAAALLTVLDISPAHVLGVSMGGMVAQLLAVRHPDQVRTLICLSSSTLDTPDAFPQPETVMTIFSPPPPGRESYLEQAVEISKLMHGPVLPHDPVRTRRRAAEAYDRGLYPAGTARQLAAIVTGIGWKKAISDLDMPVLVIHGDQDPLLPTAGARDIAETVPGARYVEMPGLGHTLPPVVWPTLLKEITEFV